MARQFNELRKSMSPARQKRIDAKMNEQLVEMLLGEIRRESGLTQNDLAQKLGIRQPSLSKLEAQDDMQVSTLRRIIAALGGELELVAHLPQGVVRLTQFKEDPQLT